MTSILGRPGGASILALLALGACSKAATSTTTAATAPVAAATPTIAVLAPAGSTPGPTMPATTAGAPGAMASGYSCSFPGPAGRTILARFTVDAGGGAHDDQGLAFAVIANSPTALVLAHARDDLATAPHGDVGAYVVAIDRRTLGMVQTTVRLNGPGGTRRGRCIVG